MLFHVTWETYPVVLDDEKRVREAIGPQLQRLSHNQDFYAGPAFYKPNPI